MAPIRDVKQIFPPGFILMKRSSSVPCAGISEELNIYIHCLSKLNDINSC